MNTWANNLFLIVFLGQIFLTSFFVPRMIAGRFAGMLAKHPPEQYPKLYPKPISHYQTGLSVFTWANRLIFLFGFVVLYAAYVLDGGSASGDGRISQGWPAAYGMIQFLPLMALELFGFHQFKKMREAKTDGTRKADLRPRKLLENVSPRLLLLAVSAFVLTLGLDLYITDFAMNWGSDVMQRDIVLVVTNLPLAAMGLWYLYGRKQDPYQSAQDRARQIRAQLSSVLLISTAMSVYFMIQSLSDVFALNNLQAPLMSLYFQAMVALSIGFVLHSLKEKDVNFEVYRDSAQRGS